jgi:hypothetical protein
MEAIAMLPLTTMTATRPTINPMVASLYAGLATAVAAVATSLLFAVPILILYILAFLLIGAGPVVGYQLATGRLGSDWKPIVGGILSFILGPLGWLIWPVLVGAMSKDQSIGKLFLATLLGIVIGIVLFLISVTAIGQNPYTIGTSFTLLCAGWGGTCGAAMTAWRKS